VIRELNDALHEVYCGTGITVVVVPGLELAVAGMPADPFTEG
jgi:hypothetical protein